MPGVASSVLRAAGWAFPKPSPELVGLWSFDETGGASFADSVGGVDGTFVGVWDDLSTASLVQGVGGTSAFKKGEAHAILPANQPAHDLSSFTLSVYYQPRTAIFKHAILSRGTGSAPGDFAIERLADGRLRAWHVGDDLAVRFFGTSDGVAGTTLVNGTAYRIDVSFGPDGSKLYLDGSLQSAIPANANGWNNTQALYVGVWQDGTTAAVDGALDHLRLWDGQLSDSEIGNLEIAVSIPLEEAPANLLGAWPLDETSGTAFADIVGANHATLTVPSWTIASHEHNRKGIVAGTDHALEVSNGGPTIPMLAGYRQAAMSLVLYAAPLGEMRGTQYYERPHEKFGREFLAYCDDGSTPGSFAIERRLVQSGWDPEDHTTWAWRLDGYVRNSAGTAVRFSGGLDGIAGATLPVDTAKRIVLTQGPAGAELWLDETKVGTLAGVTTGWDGLSLSSSISIGSANDSGHANNRSPFWGRVDQIEVWQGQLALASIQALPVAVQSRLWRWPSDFNPLTSINRANHTTWQSAMQAAHAAGTYVYQDVLGEFGAADTTYYAAPITAAAGTNNALSVLNDCKGLLQCRMRKPDGESQKFVRMVNLGNQSAGKMTSPRAGGYQIIGCEFDGNARNQNWHPNNGQAGFANTAFDLEQAHALFIGHSSTQVTVTIDACKFYDGTGDALSLQQQANVTSKSTKYYGYFRGPEVINAAPVDLLAIRNESYWRTHFGTVLNGCGMQDIEAFGGAGAACHMRWVDYWAQSDFDDQGEGTAGDDGFTRYHNTHIVTAVMILIPGGEANNKPTQRWEAYYCTFGFHRRGGNASGNSPAAWWKGMNQGANGVGCLFDHCTFVACGEPYYVHGQWRTAPTVTPWVIDYHSAGTEGPRLWTQRNCEWRVRNMAGVAAPNIQCITHQSMGTSKSVELDGVLIDAAFANLPFNMGGLTVRHRNVLHEGTGNTTPWTNAGAEVPI